VASKRIVNASPLIYLNRVGLLGILDERGVIVLVPDAVLGELTRLDPNDPTAVAVTSAPRIQVVATPAIPASVRALRLGAGESAVLALALAESDPDKEEVLDDRKARLAASTLALRVQGTLAFLLIAKSVGRIAAVRPLLERLRQGGMYISDHLMQRILNQAAE
jgi:predicted nucleic acid-binding protein